MRNYTGNLAAGKEKTKNLVLTAMFAALVFAATAYILHIPTQNGYIHIGDAFIYMAASILPAPYAVAAGAIGAALSDGLTGYAIWVLPSILIKSATAAVFTSKHRTILCRRNLLACAAALGLCAGGYYVAEGILYGNFISALASIPTNILQAVVSIIIYGIIGFALDRLKFKEKIYR